MQARFLTTLFLTASALAAALLPQCTEPTKQSETQIVQIALTSEPDALNPITYKTVNAQSINQLVFQKLIDTDFHSLELVPVLAESRPEILPLNDSLYQITYHIRNEAQWDNGDPVTAHDVIFTLKAALAPGIANEGKKNYLSSLVDATPDSLNPKVIHFSCKPGLRMEYTTGAEVAILPAHLYDPEEALRDIPFSVFIHNNADSTQSEKIATWAKDFGSHRFQKTPENIIGSGAYRVTEWVSDQRIKLQRKSNHWTQKISESHGFFDQYPDNIHYTIISEPAGITAAARNGQLHVGPIVRSPDYVALKEDENFLADFHVKLAPELTTNVILVNWCKPALQTLKTREALAHLFNSKQYIETVQKSTGQIISGPLHPSKNGYHHHLTPRNIDAEKARNLLEEDGWLDSDGDGVLDKIIDGKKVDLRLDYKYNTENEGRKNAGLMYREWARPLGIDIQVKSAEWLVFIEQIMGKDFDLAFFSWTDEHAPTDLAPLFHSASIDNGYNFGCYRNREVDALLDELSTTIDSDRQVQLYRTVQEILHREVANIFVSTNEARFFISREFEEIQPSAVSPGYFAGSLKTSD